MQNFVSARVVVCDDSGNVLVVKRSPDDTSRPGEWELPGGTVEDDEDFTAAASREIEEETGLRLGHDDLHLVWAQTMIYEGANRSRLVFRAQAVQPMVQLSHEHTDYLWLPLGQAIDKVTHPPQHTALLHIQQNNLLHS